MTADIALQNTEQNIQKPSLITNRPAPIAGDNDNDTSSRAALTSQEVHPLVQESARRLIGYHSDRTPVVIQSWGTSEIVYGEIKDQLINIGYKADISEEMSAKLVDQAIEHAEQSRSKHAAKIIAVKVAVSKLRPETQFETGALEIQRIDGHNPNAQVAGATSVSMGFSTSGTYTTAVRDAVADIMDAMVSANSSVWISFEAPNKSELEGVANDAALSAIAEIAGGGLEPAQIEALIEKLNMMAEAGLIAPEIMSAIGNLGQIQALAAAGNMAGIAELSKMMMADLTAAMEGGNANLELISAIIEAVNAISNRHGLHSVIDMNGLNNLKQQVQTALLIEQLEGISATLSGADKDTLDAMIEEMGDLEGVDLLEHLDAIEAHLQDLGIDVPEIAALQDLIIQNLPLDQRLEILAARSADSMMDLLQQLNGAEGLPPEIAELLADIDVDNLTIEELKEALATKGENAQLIESLQAIIIQLQNPDIQTMLPSNIAWEASQFFINNSATVDAVVAQAMVSDLSAMQSALNASSPEAAALSTKTPTTTRLISTGLEAGQRLSDNLASGKDITAGEATAQLELMDRAINKMPDGPEKQEAIKQRQELAEQAKDIPGMDPEVIKGHVCKDGCCPPKEDFQKAADKTRAELGNLAKNNPKIAGDVKKLDDIVKTTPELSKNDHVKEALEVLKDPKATPEQIKDAIERVKEKELGWEANKKLDEQEKNTQPTKQREEFDFEKAREEGKVKRDDGFEAFQKNLSDDEINEFKEKFEKNNNEDSPDCGGDCGKCGGDFNEAKNKKTETGEEKSKSADADSKAEAEEKKNAPPKRKTGKETKGRRRTPAKARPPEP